MAEPMLIHVKDYSLLVGAVLMALMLVCHFCSRQVLLSSFFWIGLLLFLTVGTAHLCVALLQWGVPINDALLWALTQILFMVGFVVFFQRAQQRRALQENGGNDAIAVNAAHMGCLVHPIETVTANGVAEPVIEVQPHLAEKLTEFMRLQKPYLEPHITVERLAIKLNVSPKLLSGTINNELHMNFFELISNYRVLEAKKRLADAALRDLTICEIMKSCGFNSKSVFNQAFKKSVGVTPSQYRQQQL